MPVAELWSGVLCSLSVIKNGSNVPVITEEHRLLSSDVMINGYIHVIWSSSKLWGCFWGQRRHSGINYISELTWSIACRLESCYFPMQDRRVSFARAGWGRLTTAAGSARLSGSSAGGWPMTLQKRQCGLLHQSHCRWSARTPPLIDGTY